MKVRASPQAVGVRVSKLTFDCCAEMIEMLPLFERVALVPSVMAAPPKATLPGVPGATPAKWTCSGTAFSEPLLPKFVDEAVVVLGLPPLNQYTWLTVIVPP